ncbi:MAG: hypothetical protein V9G98_27635 [Candidatus Competibacter sp.]
MLDSCGLCGESYDEDNLARCTRCGRDYCYKCGSLGVCDRCREKKEQAEKPETPPETTRPGFWHRLFGN